MLGYTYPRAKNAAPRAAAKTRPNYIGVQRVANGTVARQRDTPLTPLLVHDGGGRSTLLGGTAKAPPENVS